MTILAHPIEHPSLVRYIKTDIFGKLHPRDYFPRLYQELLYRQSGIDCARFYFAALCVIHENLIEPRTNYGDIGQIFAFFEPYLNTMIANNAFVRLDPDTDILQKRAASAVDAYMNSINALHRDVREKIAPTNICEDLVVLGAGRDVQPTEAYQRREYTRFDGQYAPCTHLENRYMFQVLQQASRRRFILKKYVAHPGHAVNKPLLEKYTGYLMIQYIAFLFAAPLKGVPAAIGDEEIDDINRMYLRYAYADPITSSYSQRVFFEALDKHYKKNVHNRLCWAFSSMMYFAMFIDHQPLTAQDIISLTDNVPECYHGSLNNGLEFLPQLFKFMGGLFYGRPMLMEETRHQVPKVKHRRFKRVLELLFKVVHNADDVLHFTFYHDNTLLHSMNKFEELWAAFDCGGRPLENQHRIVTILRILAGSWKYAFDKAEDNMLYAMQMSANTFRTLARRRTDLDYKAIFLAAIRCENIAACAHLSP